MRPGCTAAGLSAWTSDAAWSGLRPRQHGQSHASAEHRTGCWRGLHDRTWLEVLAVRSSSAGGLLPAGRGKMVLHCSWFVGGKVFVYRFDRRVEEVEIKDFYGSFSCPTAAALPNCAPAPAPRRRASRGHRLRLLTMMLPRPRLRWSSLSAVGVQIAPSVQPVGGETVARSAEKPAASPLGNAIAARRVAGSGPVGIPGSGFGHPVGGRASAPPPASRH